MFVISLCFYEFDIAFSLFINQIENTNYCITLLKGGWSIGAQEDRTALYMVPTFRFAPDLTLASIVCTLKEIVSQTDLYLASLSSKTFSVHQLLEKARHVL